MKQYLIPLLAYVLSVPVLDFFHVNEYVSYSIRAFLTAALVMYFWYEYKLKFKLDYFSLMIGVCV